MWLYLILILIPLLAYLLFNEELGHSVIYKNQSTQVLLMYSNSSIPISVYPCIQRLAGFFMFVSLQDLPD